jgi:hypothetical protein
MIYHVLPGDSIVKEFRETGIEGEVVVFRDALITGPVDAASPDEFWDARARFIPAEYGEDSIQYHESVADEIERLADVGPDDEVNLWFEYELFCSVKMWFCLSRLTDSGAEIYRVEPAMLDEAERWKGFGRAEAIDLQECFRVRQKFDDGDIALGTELWSAFTQSNSEELISLGTRGTERFPYLAEVCEAAVEIDTRPREILESITGEGEKEFADIFVEFSKRAGVYGFGDSQVEAILRASQLPL